MSSEKFSEKVTGTAPQREIDVEIELIPDAQPISETPYCTTPILLNELKIQLEKSLQKGFIIPRVSPWGAPILFVKKKNGT